MSLGFDFAIEGDLEAAADRFRNRMLLAIKDAITDSGREILEIFRADVRAAGLGEKLANAVRLEVYPAGKRLTYEPAGQIYSNADRIMSSFIDGATITPTRANALVIPIPGSPADKMRAPKGQKITEAVAARFGPLVYIPGGFGAAPILAVYGRKMKNGQVKKPIHNNKKQLMPGQDLGLIPMFFVVRQVRLEPRLSYERIKREAEASVVSRLDRNLTARLEAYDLTEQGPADV